MRAKRKQYELYFFNARLLALITISILTQTHAADSESALTLQETLNKGRAALASGDHAQAFQVFEIIEEEFGTEPELASKSSQLTLVPLHGYSALKSGQTDRAISLFEDFVARFPDDQSRFGFVFF